MNKHLFVSPHLDDVALSCGGLMADLAQRGHKVVALTLFAATPGDDELTPIARELKARWKAGEDPMARRRAEDIAACRVLGATAIHLDWADCPYRAGPDGLGLYPGEASLFGDVHPLENDLPSAIAETVGTWLADNCRVYGPLGAGHHVDHLIARDACLLLHQAGVDVWHYEDYPYADDAAEVHKALASCGDCAREPRLITLSPGALEAKLDAVACHRSQIDTFWRDAQGNADLDAMRRAITQYAWRTSAGSAASERYWTATREESR